MSNHTQHYLDLNGADAKSAITVKDVALTILGIVVFAAIGVLLAYRG